MSPLKLKARPAPKPWAHRHRLVPLYVDPYRRHIGYCCADVHCDELFTPTGNVSNPTPRLNDTRPMAHLEGRNHQARRLARGTGRSL